MNVPSVQASPDIARARVSSRLPGRYFSLLTAKDGGSLHSGGFDDAVDRVFLLRMSLARDTRVSVVLLGFVGWQLRVPVPPIHLTSALSFSLRLSFFPSSTPSIYSNLAVLKQPAEPFPFYQKFLCFIPLSPPSDTMASTRVLASRLASSMASTTTKVARPAMRVQVANASKRTITGKELI